MWAVFEEELFGDMWNRMDKQKAWMERQDTLLANLRREQPREVPNARRHCG